MPTLDRSEWVSYADELLDRDSPFLELCPLAGHEVEGHATGASVSTS